MKVFKVKVVLSAAGAWVLWRLLAREILPRFDAPQERPTRLTGRTVLVLSRCSPVP